MKTTMMTGLALLAFLLTACQSNQFKIDGVAEGFNDGDTLFITNGFASEPTDTIIVKNGKFEYQGEVDSVNFCAIYAQSGVSGTAFFKEPGTIKIELNADGTARISGTKANDGWQELDDYRSEIGNKIDELTAPLYTQELDSVQQAAIIQECEEIQKQLTVRLGEMLEKHIDNELGFFLITQMDGSGTIGPEKMRELIGKIPADYKKRDAFKKLEKKLEATEATTIGHQIEDFSLPTPQGDELSVMSEVSKNKVTILDFWASWCGPCCEEMPFMVSLYEKYHDKGLGIVGISLDQDHDAWTGGIEKLGITWPQVSDLGFWQSPVVEMFQVQAIPYMVVVDQQGIILNKNIRGKELEDFISSLL